jgi:hypothetical protein
MLGNLDNGIIFKKAFTDKFVFESFTKDILGFDVKVDKIETEKQFTPKVGRIAFELDIFAETEDKRMVIELQRVEYDYGFDRFLHYFLMLIAEQQSGSRDYKINRTVFVILVMTQPYKLLKDLEGNAVEEEILVTTLHTENAGKDDVPIYPHRLITLNPNHRHKDTPKQVRDWLDLMYESINNPENPNINLENPAIVRAVALIDEDNLTPQELQAKKFIEMARTVKQIDETYIKYEMAKKLYENGVAMTIIMQTTGFSELEIKQYCKIK